MSAIESVTPRAGATRGLATEPCPWCGSVISRAKFVEIEERIRAEERQRHAEQEAILKKQLQEREAQIRKQLAEESDRKLKVSLLEAGRKRQEELEEQRRALEKDRDLTLVRQKAQFAREREVYQKKLRDVERRLEARTANELGEGAEVDLYEAMKDAFPGDGIRRIKKGESGADIIYEAIYKGTVCGRIILDSKNRQGWQNAYVTKLREDKLAVSADHAILATTVFPREQKELCVEDDVIIVNPARAIHIVKLLRLAMLRMHQLGLSTKERQTKMSALYAFITSQRFAERMHQAQALTQEVLDVDVQEQEAHRKVWRARGTLTVRLQKLMGGLNDEIMGLVEGVRS